MHGSAQTLKKALILTYSDNPVTRYGKTSIIYQSKQSTKDKENYNENTKTQNSI